MRTTVFSILHSSIFAYLYIALRVYFLGIRQTIPTEVGLLQNLVILDFDFNVLSGSLPNELSNLKRLTQLDMNNNFLTGSLSSIIRNFPLMEFMQFRKFDDIHTYFWKSCYTRYVFIFIPFKNNPFIVSFWSSLFIYSKKTMVSQERYQKRWGHFKT